MAPKLYMIPSSPPVRSVLMTANHLGVQLDLEHVNLFAKEQFKPEFLKINPQHTVPVLDDDGYVLADSHAINAYLVGKYGKDDSLYPKDLQKRGLVDQRLHFDTGVLFPSLITVLRAIAFQGAKSISEGGAAKIREGYEFLDKFLDGKQWLAGDHLTIADLNNFATTSGLNALIPLNPQEYPNLARWYKRLQGTPCTEAGNEGLKQFTDIVKSKLG